MPETPEQAEQRALRELEGKNVAHYSVLLQAWIDTRMERDRTIVTLSAAGIGLLVTISTIIGVNRWWDLIFYAGALAGFIIAIYFSLSIYQLNSEHIENAMRGSSECDPRLEKCDKASFRGFVAGVFLAMCIGLSSAIAHLPSKGKRDTAQDSKKQDHTTQNVPLRESVQGLERLSPNQIGDRRLNGITNPEPQSTRATGAPQLSVDGQGGAQPALQPTNRPSTEDKK